jgi:hypothetical protein
MRAAVSVSDMARLCSLSRTRFYELIHCGVMPQPCYCLRTRRPLYPGELQEACLRVVATNVGFNGSLIVFYNRDTPATGTARPRRRPGRQGAAPTPSHGDLIDGLRSLGVCDVTDAQVEAALRHEYPSGCAGEDDGAVLRAVWRHLRRAGVV